MKIFIAGNTGVISSALIGFLMTQGHSIYCSKPVLPQSSQDSFCLPAGLSTFTNNQSLDAVIYSGDEILPGKKWQHSTAPQAYDNKILMTKYLSEHLAKMKRKPKVLIIFSNSGYYGDREDRILVETSFVGEGLHAEKCRQLEIATNPARQAGIRVVYLRTARVLGLYSDPFLDLYLPNQKLFTGIWGSGKQYVSWISIDDAVSAIDFILGKEDISGPVNLTSPTSVSNQVFAKTLTVQDKPFLQRPTPAFVVRQLFDTITASVLLSSCRVSPRRLMVAGFKFKHSKLEKAIDIFPTAQIL